MWRGSDCDGPASEHPVSGTPDIDPAAVRLAGVDERRAGEGSRRAWAQFFGVTCSVLGRPDLLAILVEELTAIDSYPRFRRGELSGRNTREVVA